jgi:hypothetical protein
MGNKVWLDERIRLMRQQCLSYHFSATYEETDQSATGRGNPEVGQTAKAEPFPDNRRGKTSTKISHSY